MLGFDRISKVPPVERTDSCGLLIMYSKEVKPYWEFKGTETMKAVDEITLHAVVAPLKMKIEFPNFPLQENPDEIKLVPVMVTMLPRYKDTRVDAIEGI